jgi:hypothetical protein
LNCEKRGILEKSDFVFPSDCFIRLILMAKNDWIDRVAIFQSSLRLNDSNLIRQTFVRLDSMDSLSDLLIETLEDVKLIGRKIEELVHHVVQSNSQEGIFIEGQLLQDLVRGDVLLSACSTFQDSLLFRRIYEDSSAWSYALRTMVSNWKANSLILIKQLLEDSKLRCRESFGEKKPTELKDHLDLLNKYGVFDSYLEPTASSVYLDTCSYLRVGLHCLVESARNSLERGDLEKYNSIRLFLEASTSYGAHFEDIDFKSMISSMSKNHQQVVDRIPEDIENLLTSHRYQSIRGKLVSIK